MTKGYLRVGLARRNLRQRTIYLLPNLFTTSALFCGFFAIIRSMNGDFSSATLAIFVSTVLDNLDGRVARLTHTQSAFGAEYDSLSDMICFGVAPALIIYEWILKSMGRAGWGAAFIYCVTAALRLARFNASVDDESTCKAYFSGLPSPVSALLLMSYVSVMQTHNDFLSTSALAHLSLFLTVFSGLSMVSSIPFYSGKNINFRKSIPFSHLMWVVFTLVLISQSFLSLSETLFLLSVLYLLWSYGTFLFSLVFRRSYVSKKEKEEAKNPHDNHSI